MQDGSADRRKRIGEQFYDLSHGLPYKLTMGGLYALSPVTGGLSAIPATAMAVGSGVSTVNDMATNGVSLGNGVNAAFDALDLGAGIGSAAKQAIAYGARGALPGLVNSATKANVAESAAREALDAARSGVKRAAWGTAKAIARRDAAAVYGSSSPAYRGALRKLAAAREVYRDSGVPYYIEKVVTPGGAVLNRTVNKGVAGTAIKNVGRKLRSYGYAQGASATANGALRNAEHAIRNGVEWRPVAYSNLALPFA